MAHFHRYGNRSRYLERPTDAELNATNVKGLGEILKDILQAEKTILYYGSKSPDEVIQTLKKGFIGKTDEIKSQEPYQVLRAFKAEKNKIYFFEKEMAQAQVRLEFSAGIYDENKMPATQIFNEYFGGGMAGLVFQELREARALAYSAWAQLLTLHELMKKTF